MQFVATDIDGLFVLEVERHADERGFFARTWCEQEAAAHGLTFGTVQCNVSFNHQKGTLRGMHYQLPPFEEIKIVRCTAGALLDVVVDIRAGSRTYGKTVAAELTPANHRALYIPAGCAHGFQTLADDTEVFYQMSNTYSPQHARGFRWNDPQFALPWPEPISVISERDRTYPDFVLQPAPTAAHD